jgi:hypothetical protein
MAQPASFLVAHARPLQRLSDRLRVNIVVLVALHEGRRHQPHIVPLPSQDAATVMAPASRLHADPAGRQGRRQGDQSLPGHAATEHSPTLGILPTKWNTDLPRSMLSVPFKARGKVWV